MKIDKLTDNIIRFRWLVILAVAVGTVFFAFQTTKLTIDADVLSSLPDDDKHALLLKKIGQNFGGNRMGIVILETDNIYQTSVIEHIRAITDTVGKINGISSVSSISNIINIKGSEFGIEIGRLVDEYDLPQTKEDFDLLRSNIAGNEMYKGSIVSDDETSCLVVFTLDDSANVNEVARTVLDKTQALQLPEKLYYIGSPMLITYIAELMKNDLVMLLPIAFLLIAIILFMSFRSIKGVILPLLSAVIAIIWSLGTMSLLGYSMSMISNNIPIILLAIGSAYTIHVVNRVNQIGKSKDTDIVKSALNYVMVPVVLAAITTVIGFISFVFGAYLDMIVDFGIFTALGTFVACLMAIFFVPAILATLPQTTQQKDTKKGNEFIEKRFLIPLKNTLFKRSKLIIWIWLLAIGISLTGIMSIERSVDIQEYFKKGIQPGKPKGSWWKNSEEPNRYSFILKVICRIRQC